MASKWYPKGLTAVMKGEGAMDANVKVMLVNTGYVFSDAHDFLNDVSGYRIGTDIAVANEDVSASGGTVKFDGDDTGLTWAAVATGSTVIGVITYVDTGDEATSLLLTFNELPEPKPTNGGDMVLNFNAGGIATITC